MNRQNHRPADVLTDAADREPTPPQAHEPVVAGLLYLLVQASTRGACMHQVLAIGHHLDLLAQQQASGAMLRDTCLKLHAQWMQCIANVEAERNASPMTIDRAVH